MALDIKDPETDRLAHDLAELTGEPLTAAVRTAVRERLERERRARPKKKEKASVEELLAIAAEVASRPAIDPRTPDEIIGYDERGLPT